VRYKVCNRASETITGVGQTVSVSRSGMSLQVQHALEVGDRVAVTVRLLETGKFGRAELTLVGQVIRVEQGRVALQFDDPDIENAQEQS